MASTGGERITLAAAAARVDSAIELGRITAQQAPAGHPIFAAIARAEQARGELADLASVLSDGEVIGPGSRTWAQMARAIDDITDAAASVRTTGPLKATIWPAGSVPWGWVAAGAGALVLVALLFQPGRGR